ncbi:MAG TPA: winged helix-turn-helix domain-containing protein, partial [Vicinamibacterales bacterium]
MKYVFSPFSFETVSGELQLEGRRIPLLGTASELLRVLIEERHRVVSKDELLRRIWRGAAVEEGNLSTYIAKLRTALDDDPQAPRFIRTHHGRGYRFIAEVTGHTRPDTRTRRPSGFVLDWDGRELSLAQGENIIGRTAAAGGISIADPHVSGAHARIVVDGDTATIEDLHSKNHTFVGPVCVTGPLALRVGDVIRFGGPTVVFRRATVKTVTVK